jgi:hypothetical protein
MWQLKRKYLSVGSVGRELIVIVELHNQRLWVHAAPVKAKMPRLPQCTLPLLPHLA